MIAGSAARARTSFGPLPIAPGNVPLPFQTQHGHVSKFGSLGHDPRLLARHGCDPNFSAIKRHWEGNLLRKGKLQDEFCRHFVAAAEFGRYGVTVNAIAPAARTRMTEATFDMTAPDSGFDAMAPENVSPLVVWLGSVESAGVTGRVFEVSGGQVGLADGWRHGPVRVKGTRWAPAELGPVVAELLAEAVDPEPVYGA